MELPKDPMMLFSLINMKLRDFYPSLDALCSDLNVNKEDIVNRLKEAGFEYNPEQNKFWCSDTPAGANKNSPDECMDTCGSSGMFLLYAVRLIP